MRSPARARAAAAVALVLAAAALSLLAGARPAAAAAKPPRRLQQAGIVPADAFGIESMAGKAKGRKAGGQPDPVPGLVQPDIPHLSVKTASMEDLVLPYGYPLETYPVETADGFILRMYRIPYGVRNSTKPTAAGKPVVLLFHGVTLASNSFAVLDPESSMAFYLADAGFDVWMSNTRGNTYSRGNRYARSTDQDYWDNSMDQLALFDRPTQIDFVLNKTGASSIGTIGHSQGCTLTLMLLASQVEYNNKLWMLMLMGPVTHSEYIQTPFLRQQAKTGSAVLLADAGIGSFIPNYITAQMVSGCADPKATQWCLDLVNFMFYGPSKVIHTDDYMRVAATWPAGVAVRNLYHWSQMYHTRNGIYMYDYGTNCSRMSEALPFRETCNQAKYGHETPPQYDMGRVNTTAALLTGDIDLMSTRPDVAQLRKQWNARVVFDHEYKNTAHMDFVWARDPIMKPDIIRILWDNAPAIYKRKK